MRYEMRRAQGSDLDAVMSVIDARRQWLAGLGSRQWSTLSFSERMADAISQETTWLLEDQGEPVGTLTMSTVGSPLFWSPVELAQPALYLAKMATLPVRSGEGLGQLLIDWTVAYGLDRGISRVRWDSWRSNGALHRHWQSIGAAHIRTEDAPGWSTGALFEVAYMPRRADLELWVTPPPGQSVVGALPASVERRPVPTPYDLEPAETTGADHDHMVHGITTPTGPLHVPGADRPVLIADSGAGWHAWTVTTQPVQVDDRRLQPGHPYQAQHARGAGECSVAILQDADLAAAPAADRVIA